MSERDSDSGTTSAWPSVLILVFGVLITTFAVLATYNDAPLRYGGMAWIVGPLFLLVGGGALMRSRRDTSPPPPG